MSQSRKTNRDHAKKTQRPMVEDEIIADQLEALLTPAITRRRKLLSSTRAKGQNSQLTIHGRGNINLAVARGGRSH